MKKIITILLLSWVLLPDISFCQEIESDFGHHGLLQKSAGIGVPTAKFVLPRSNDQYLVVGRNERRIFQPHSGGVFRTLVDVWVRCFYKSGEIVSDFGDEGTVIIGLPGNQHSTEITHVFLDKQNRMYLTGRADLKPVVVRLTSKGKLDHSFAEKGIFWKNELADVSKIKTHRDVSGTITALCLDHASQEDFYLLAVDSTGHIRSDWKGNTMPLFKMETYFPSYERLSPQAIMVRPDQSIWIGGGVHQASLRHPFILQFKPDGALDSTFAQYGLLEIMYDDLYSIYHFLPVSEDIMLLGCQTSHSGTLMRMNARGEIDTQFADNGFLKVPAEIRPPISPPFKLISSGTDTYYGLFSSYICKFHLDGSIDPQFGFEGFLKWELRGGTLTQTKDICKGPQGSLYFTGIFEDQNFVGRILTDGTLDPDFEGIGFKTFEIQEGGSIGTAIIAGSQGDFWMAGLTGNFWEDGTFGPIYFNRGYLRHLSKEGKTLQTIPLSQPHLAEETYHFFHGLGNQTFFLSSVRAIPILTAYLPDGSPDSSFGKDSHAVTISDTNQIFGINRAAIQAPDGNIWVAGRYTIGFGIYPGIISYTADGQLNKSFNGLGVTNRGISLYDLEVAKAIHRYDDGRILIGGSVEGNFFLMRFLASGKTDSSFNKNGLLTIDLGQESEDRCLGFVVRQNGDIIAGGQSTHVFALISFHENGDINTSFGDDGRKFTYFEKGQTEALTMAELPGGGILIGGKFTDKETLQEDLALACYLPNGSLDSLFGEAGLLRLDAGSAYEAIYDISVNADSSILLSGTTHDRSLVIKILPYRQVIEFEDPIENDFFQITQVYPNPLQRDITLQYSLSHAQRIQIRLLSLQGQELATLLDTPHLKGSHKQYLSLPAGLSADWYLIALDGQEGRRVVKILVRH